MLRDHRVGILAEFFQRRPKFLVAAVSHRNHRIPAQPGKLGAPDRRSAKHFPELFLLHFGQPVERWIDQAFPRLELRRGSHRSLAIPRANILTDVASENVPSHARAELDWNLAPLLDGQIGNAQPGVQFAGRNNRLRWTSGYAASASTATIRRRQVGRDVIFREIVFREIVFREIKRGKDYAQKQPRSQLLVDDASILADPSDASILGIHPLYERAGVNIRT